MKKLPRSREVDQAIRGVVREVKLAAKELNEQAATLLKRNDYEGAKAMMRTGELLGGFGNRVSALQGEWRALKGTVWAEKKPKKETTPLWKFYEPIARVLLEAGGKAKRRDLEEAVGDLLHGQLEPGDLVVNKRGEPRWKVMVRRARRPMIDEGFLEDTKGSWWRLAAKGSELASKGGFGPPGE